MRRNAFLFLIPLFLPPSVSGLKAQELEDDARWLARCERDNDDGVRATFCDEPVEIEAR